MTTSPKPRLYDPRRELDVVIDAGDRAYYQGRLRNNLYNLILSKFREQERTNGLTKAVLARRIERAPAVITRYLSSPSNLTVETISDLLLGICGEEMDPQSSSIEQGGNAPFGGISVSSRFARQASHENGRGSARPHDIAPIAW